jgi:hypothetical protein
MDLNILDFKLFDISIQSMNIFSFVIGMFYASVISWFGRKALIQVVMYFMILSVWYASNAWLERTKTGNTVSFDCRTAEWSLDISKEALEACRKINKQNNTTNTPKNQSTQIPQPPQPK